ncbi:hypothetical protein SAMN02910298_00973 [Pseudobutyrivibrio sp. YE44]|uniref:hypothetical protein n=1 Tax=Pseudobutyrivibrio sp. YE44 TaxID=1520802 RepID=UPI0008916AE6|nr:hypothetical protein [Pseudobutyrivibrio sp. YE44]SDB20632.1 hypothetical protein SAMN02910298_00973 [Pseudobutyrivibrio sp. YE44]
MKLFKAAKIIKYSCIFILISFFCIACSKSYKNIGEEETSCSLNNVVSEDNEKDLSIQPPKEEKSDVLNQGYIPVANNPFFFQASEKEYMYAVKLFFNEDITEVPVKLSYIKSYNNGDVYSLAIQHEDCLERYYYDVLDRFDIGTFYVTDEDIYLLLQCEDIPDEEQFISDGLLVCSEKNMDENIDGLHLKLKNDEETCSFYYDNTLTESGYYFSYKWTKEKGLTHFRSGYGAEGSPIEIELKE